MTSSDGAAGGYPSDIRPLTGLRIAAAVWVMLFHFRDHLGLNVDGMSGLVAKGYLGVDLFFILSGFIIAHVYLSKVETGSFGWLSFLWARLARLYPIHLVTLAAMIGLWALAKASGAAFDEVAYRPSALPANLLLVHAWGFSPSVSWNFPSWSISAEWFAYLAFPAFALFATRLKSAVAVATSAAVFVGMFLATGAMGILFTDMTAQIGLVRIIPSFAMGAALYQLGRRLPSRPRLATLLTLTGITWVIALASLRVSDVLIWPGLALMVFGLAEGAKQARRAILGRPLPVYLGQISYSVYMVHLPVDIAWFHSMQRLLPQPGPVASWLLWLSVFPVVLGVAAVTYHLIEKPARQWMRARDPFSGGQKALPGRWLQYWPLALVMAFAAALYASGAWRLLTLENLQQNEIALRGFVSDHSVAAILAFALVYAAAAAVAVPGVAVLTLAGGYLFGTWLGGGATLIGATAGAIIIFLVSSSSFGAPLRRLAEKRGGRLKSILDGFGAHAFSYILTLRLVPLFPFWLVNVAAGFGRAPLRAFVLASLLGMAPATFIYSAIGAGLAEVFASGGQPDLSSVLSPKVLVPLVGVALLSLTPVIYSRLKNRNGPARDQ